MIALDDSPHTFFYMHLLVFHEFWVMIPFSHFESEILATIIVTFS